jgi:predicted nuclease of predicted toxin-antitoxin system
MNLLTDHDVYAITSRFLALLGHDVVRAADAGLAQAPDDVLLAEARRQGRILVTRDRDFGALVFVQGGAGGVIYLRVEPSTVAAVHLELERVLSLYQENELLAAFTVVEPGRHRIRRLHP